MEISRTMNGGGHKLAAGAQVDGKMDETMQQVIAKVAAVIGEN